MTKNGILCYYVVIRSVFSDKCGFCISTSGSLYVASIARNFKDNHFNLRYKIRLISQEEVDKKGEG